jgi:hypothetical protein
MSCSQFLDWSNHVVSTTITFKIVRAEKLSDLIEEICKRFKNMLFQHNLGEMWLGGTNENHESYWTWTE